MLFEFAPQLMLIEGNTARTAPQAKAAPAAYSRAKYRLIDCPPVAYGLRYLLIGRGDKGKPVVLGIGRATSSSDTLNLADIRHRAATLEATEVHLLSDL